MPHRFRLPVLFLSLCFFSCCAPRYLKYVSNYQFRSANGEPVYENPDYWAANPHKKSLSDSIPGDLSVSWIKDTAVDVFFLYPTTYGNKDGAWNAAIDDSVINARTDYSTILFQASVFNEHRIFSPRYRQANIRAYYTSDKVAAKAAFDLAYGDIKKAFQYYLDHENGGRPIIIASHSQGSTHAQRLLKDFFDGKPLQKQLVAAYVLGMAVPKNSFATLKPCTDSAQTGCVISWRTYKEGYEPGFVKKENGNAIVINPLTWKTDTERSPRFLNKGGILMKFNKLAPAVADAQIHDDILWAHRPHFPGSILFRRKNYHIGDINLYYVNIRDNIRTRVSSFMRK